MTSLLSSLHGGNTTTSQEFLPHTSNQLPSPRTGQSLLPSSDVKMVFLALTFQGAHWVWVRWNNYQGIAGRWAKENEIKKRGLADDIFEQAPVYQAVGGQQPNIPLEGDRRRMGFPRMFENELDQTSHQALLSLASAVQYTVILPEEFVKLCSKKQSHILQIGYKRRLSHYRPYSNRVIRAFERSRAKELASLPPDDPAPSQLSYSRHNLPTPPSQESPEACEAWFLEQVCTAFWDYHTPGEDDTDRSGGSGQTDEVMRLSAIYDTTEYGDAPPVEPLSSDGLRLSPSSRRRHFGRNDRSRFEADRRRAERIRHPRESREGEIVKTFVKEEYNGVFDLDKVEQRCLERAEECLNGYKDAASKEVLDRTLVYFDRIRTRQSECAKHGFSIDLLVDNNALLMHMLSVVQINMDNKGRHLDWLRKSSRDATILINMAALTSSSSTFAL
nr:uncharacterized protein CI109_002141 [Kwoniella shandongensis]KAA5529251.1 hypothetical protein CI109_002141 [Kwoniella shandongensis]